MPFLGIGARPAELALVALAIPPLLTNTYVGMAGVDDDVREAARGMGMTGTADDLAGRAAAGAPATS